MVVKRDGSQSAFDLNCINRATALAFHEVLTGTAANPSRDDLLACFGLDGDMFVTVTKIAVSASQMLEVHYGNGKHPTVEQVQDVVEMAIAAAGRFDVARAFILYRARHAERRLNGYADSGGLKDYIAISRYARFRPDLGRRETFAEGVARVCAMHNEFFAEKLMRDFPAELPADVRELAGEHAGLLAAKLCGRTLHEVINETFAQVADRKVLPSMRSLQFGGQPILAKHARMFNCSFSNVDRVAFWKEYFYLLLCGCGVGFSVQRHHVTMIPALPTRAKEDDLPVWHHCVPDTIEGWADSLEALFRSFYEGKKIEFDYSEIRPAGAPLKTSGGKAPGHLPLKRMLVRVESILEQSAGRQLRPIEIYDINMFVARAVLAGGIRRSATIALFSAADEEMMNAKTGDWFSVNPQRAASNNSAVLSRSADNEAVFKKLFEAMKAHGEPGFYFCDDPDAGANPCVEISLKPTIDWQMNSDETAALYRYGYQGDLPGTTRLSGFQMCNLSTINGAAVQDVDGFAGACIAAATIGTMQAAYTDMPYLGAVTRVINEKDALLGVSICGVLDNPEVLCNPETLASGAKLCRATNRLVASLIGIQPSARTTCVKPEGTASLLLGSADGIHPHHSRHYFRRVTANRRDEIFRFFKATNSQMVETCVYNPQRDEKLVFPVTAPKGALLRKDITAVQFLEIVKAVQQAWVMNGRDDDSRDPLLNHNVSNTCTFAPDEVEAVARFIWNNRAYFTGISLLAASGDKTYPQAPREEVMSETDVAKWNALQPRPVDYTQLREATDETNLKEIVACAGGSCSVV